MGRRTPWRPRCAADGRGAEGQVDYLLLRRPHRSAREGAALTIDSSLVLN
jgi:hypothetical protein